jgi:hypothetical protein
MKAMVDHLMSNIPEIQALDANIKQATVLVEFGSAIERLSSNRDFKKVILEGYFEQEAIRLVHLKADPNMQANLSQAEIVKQMDAIGSLKQYLRTATHLAGMGARSIASDEETREELLAGEIA